MGFASWPRLRRTANGSTRTPTRWGARTRGSHAHPACPRLPIRAAPPGRPACQVRVGRDDQKRAHRLRQIQDPVVLQSGRSETVCGGSVIPPPGQSGSRLSQGADDQCSVAAAADMAAEVADKPQPSD